jgi:hypothetical protein
VIHHISVPAGDPLNVARVLAALCGGNVVPFTVHPGSYIVLMLDEVGTTIEIYPAGTEMIPGNGDQQSIFSHNPQPSGYTATHVALTVPASLEKILEVAARAGWRALYCRRQDLFDVVEFWIENKVLLELLPPTIAPQYLAFMQPQNLKQYLTSAAIPVLQH